MGKIAIPVELTIPTGGPSEVGPLVSLNWFGGHGNNGYFMAFGELERLIFLSGCSCVIVHCIL